jgi:hypothetical protein
MKHILQIAAFTLLLLSLENGVITTASIASLFVRASNTNTANASQSSVK